MFEPYLSCWNLIPDGDPIVTRAARLLPVKLDGQKAMLKLAVEEEERAGAVLMVWWHQTQPWSFVRTIFRAARDSTMRS